MLPSQLATPLPGVHPKAPRSPTAHRVAPASESLPVLQGAPARFFQVIFSTRRASREAKTSKLGLERRFEAREWHAKAPMLMEPL